MIKINNVINELEKYWDIPNGLFYQLRYNGIFNAEKFENFIELVESIEIEGEQIDRRLVSLLWYIPLFMDWQKERVLEQGGDVKHLERATNQILDILEEKLGIP